MELENIEQTEVVNPRKHKYIVRICVDTAMMRTFVKFDNRVSHPRVTMNILITAFILLTFPSIFDGVNLTATVIAYAMGILIGLFGLFRHHIAVNVMKNSPDVKVDEEIVYSFGNTGVWMMRGKKEEKMGNYNDLSCLWEDEKHYYAAMKDQDVLVLPKQNFEEGDAVGFRDFILEKSNATYIWKPVRVINVLKNKITEMQIRMSQMGKESEKAEKEK